MAPYRDAVPLDTVAAEIEGGRVELTIGPDHLLLSDGFRSVEVTAQRIATRRKRRKRVIRREQSLDGRAIYVTRGFPTRELAVWFEARPGAVERLWGAAPPLLLDDGAMAAGRALDRLALRLVETLTGRATCHLATEFGRGGHRVLLATRGDQLVAYARPLFRDLPRRCLELDRAGGLVVVPRRGAEVAAQVSSRFDVVAHGDRIHFVGSGGDDVGVLYLPWVSPEDRFEIASRFARWIDPRSDDLIASPAARPVFAAQASLLARSLLGQGRR